MHKNKHVFSFVADQTIIEKYPAEASMLREGIFDVLHVAGLNPVLKNISRKDSHNLSKLVEMHKNPNGNVEVASLADRLIDNNYSSPNNPGYLLIADEIEVYTRNDIGSYVVREEGLAVQSLSRFTKTWMKTSLDLYRFIGRHTYAHLLGLNGSSVTEKTGHTPTGHCQNECTMQKMSSVNEALDRVDTLRNRKLAGFCLQCVDALRAKHA